MAEVWSQKDDVRCMHPGSESVEGHRQVTTSWEQIFSAVDPFDIRPAKTQINVSGQIALCRCIEETNEGGKLECLNIYRREEGSWKMILHMASPIIMPSLPFKLD